MVSLERKGIAKKALKAITALTATTIIGAAFAPHVKAQEIVPQEHQIRLSPREAGLRLREPSEITAEKQKLEAEALAGPKSLGLNGLLILKTGGGEYHPVVWLGKSFYLVTGAGKDMALQKITAGQVSAGVSGKAGVPWLRYGLQATGQYGSKAGGEVRGNIVLSAGKLDLSALLSTQGMQGTIDWRLGPKQRLSTVFSNRNAALQFSQLIEALKTRLEAGVARDWEEKYPRGTAQLRAIFDDWFYVHGGIDFMGGTGSHGAGTYVGAGVTLPLDLKKPRQEQKPVQKPVEPFKQAPVARPPIVQPIAPTATPAQEAVREALKFPELLGYELGLKPGLVLRQPQVPGLSEASLPLTKREALEKQLSEATGKLAFAEKREKKDLQNKIDSIKKELQAIQKKEQKQKLEREPAAAPETREEEKKAPQGKRMESAQPQQISQKEYEDLLEKMQREKVVMPPKKEAKKPEVKIAERKEEKPKWMPPHVKRVVSIATMEKIIRERLGLNISEELSGGQYTIKIEDPALAVKVVSSGDSSQRREIRDKVIRKFYEIHLKTRLENNAPLFPEELEKQ